MFQELADYRVSGVRTKFFHEKKKTKDKSWGFLLRNVLNFGEIMDILGTDDDIASFGMITGESYMDLRDYLRMKSYIIEKEIILLGPNSPAFMGPLFSIKKNKTDIQKEGNIAILTRSQQTLEYGMRYLNKRSYKIKYGISLGESILPFCDFFEIIPHLFKEDVDAVVCINESGTLLNLPDFYLEKPVIFLQGGTFLFEEESSFKNYIENIGILTPEKSLNNLIKMGINVTYTFKDLVDVLKIFAD
jgi:succinyl-CoA synthetase alpha subunit